MIFLLKYLELICVILLHEAYFIIQVSYFLFKRVDFICDFLQMRGLVISKHFFSFFVLLAYLLSTAIQLYLLINLIFGFLQGSKSSIKSDVELLRLSLSFYLSLCYLQLQGVSFLLQSVHLQIYLF